MDSLDRYRLIGEAERNATLAGFHASLHNIALFKAYEAPWFFEMMQDMGKIYGVDALLWNPVEGAPASKRVKVARSHAENFVLAPAGLRWTNTAFKHLNQSVRHANITWAELKDQPVWRWAALDPSMFTPFARGTGLTLKYRNYFRGRPTGWSIQAYKPYFPGITGQDDVAEAARILSQA